jgi:hypothetical protein
MAPRPGSAQIVAKDVFYLQAGCTDALIGCVGIFAGALLALLCHVHGGGLLLSEA